MVKLQIEGRTIDLPPDIAVNDDAIRRAIAPIFPAVANATFTRHDGENGITVIKISKHAGTKGHSESIIQALNQAPRYVNPIFTLYQQLCQSSAPSTAEEFFTLLPTINPTIERGEEEQRDIHDLMERLAHTPGRPATRRPIAF